jgi:hypothetical protein
MVSTFEPMKRTLKASIRSDVAPVVEISRSPDPRARSQWRKKSWGEP